MRPNDLEGYRAQCVSILLEDRSDLQLPGTLSVGCLLAICDPSAIKRGEDFPE
ncbi:hypothetical protein CC78DRAFT_131471 [Lojkania enalia]|uniref:Uncharacterized protein n=1 Tax=Lojkania enalia TaxID=147567 RepID=A0A9P4NBV6_9PLEO|nr:hypothetical protein CC78DRAFT_131471 [Didymosphaeria enalia]